MTDIVFLGINEYGRGVYDWLCDREDASVLALLTERSQLELIEKLEPALVVSAGFRHIVPEDVLEVPELGCVNLHPSYLPFNRGANPNVWSIVEDTPAGVSIHYMSPEVDEGDIIARRKVDRHPDDTGRTLYERLERAQLELFTEHWPDVRDGTAQPTSQDPVEGTCHYEREFDELCELDLTETVEIGDLIDRLRALTYPPYDNAYFERDGDRYFVELRVKRDGDET